MSDCRQNIVHVCVDRGVNRGIDWAPASPDEGPSVFEVEIVRDRDGVLRCPSRPVRLVYGPPLELVAHASSGPRAARFEAQVGPASVALSLDFCEPDSDGQRNVCFRPVPGGTLTATTGGRVEVGGEPRDGMRVTALFSASAIDALKPGRSGPQPSAPAERPTVPAPVWPTVPATPAALDAASMVPATPAALDAASTAPAPVWPPEPTSSAYGRSQAKPGSGAAGGRSPADHVRRVRRVRRG
jgi:hypothetical protein